MSKREQKIVFDRIFGGHSKAVNRFFDGEPTPPPSGPPAGEETITVMPIKDPATGKVTYKTPDGVPFFTQEHLNTEIGNARVTARKTVDAEKSQLQQQLESLKADAEAKGLNVDALTSKIKELEEANMSAEQLSQRRVQDLETQFKTTEANLKGEVSKAMSLFTEEHIGNQITKACIAHKAISAEQITPLIRANTELVPEKDAKGTIKGYKAVVHFQDQDDEGNVVMRDLSIEEAVKRMREIPVRFGNLFKSEQESGSGNQTLFGQSTESARVGSVLTPGKTDQNTFNEWAKAQGI